MSRKPEKLVRLPIYFNIYYIGIRIEDFYCNKFHKEPYIQHHIYAQYFHPETLLERVRDVQFYRRPRTLFKGFRVPDWATAEKRHGWEFDAYSREAWNNALHDLHSEWTPMQFVGERQEPNVIEWLRFEQWGKGSSSRLFYNEKVNNNWFRFGGHLDNKENLYSFTKAEQEDRYTFGYDTTTAEGREGFKKEWETMAAYTPELLSKDDLVYPHEVQNVSTEPYFRRIWQLYREHTFRLRVAQLVEDNQISAEDAEATRRFLSLRGSPSLTTYLYARLGKLSVSAQNADFQATERVFQKLGLDQIEMDKTTAQPYECQFWSQYDIIQQLSEEELRRDLPILVTDLNNRAKVEALLEDRKVLPNEETHKLAVSH